MAEKKDKNSSFSLFKKRFPSLVKYTFSNTDKETIDDYFNNPEAPLVMFVPIDFVLENCIGKQAVIRAHKQTVKEDNDCTCFNMYCEDKALNIFYQKLKKAGVDEDAGWNK